MRDILLMLFVGGLLPFALFRPFVGLLVFSWLAYFRPQELCWSFARDFPFSFVVGGVMILGIVLGNLFGSPFSREERAIRMDRRSMLLILFWVALGLASLFAVHPEASRQPFVQLSKILLIALLTTGLCRTRERFRLLLLVIALSLGAMALKHALFAVRTGEFRILKGPGGMMQDNNDFGLALVMALPLLYYVMLDEKNAWLKAVSFLFGAATLATIFFTHSRSGFVAVAVIGVFWLFKFRRRAWTWILGPALIVATMLLLPSDLIDRMRSLWQGTPDKSVQLRVVAWEKALNMGMDRPVFGVGPGNFTELWHDYAPVTPEPPIVAHNTFLQLFAEGGAAGLVLFLALILASIAGLILLRRQVLADPEERWRVNYSHALELSILGFVAGALFLTRVDFDLFYHLVGMIPALIWARDRGEEPAEIFAYWRPARRPGAARDATPERA